MDAHDRLAAYYRSPEVRARINEYCGEPPGWPSGANMLRIAGYGGVRHLTDPEGGPVPCALAALTHLFEDGADVCRSLADPVGTLLQLDVDYVDPGAPAEPYLHPDVCFARLEPVYRTLHQVFATYGARPLVVMTGRGYHFMVRFLAGGAAHAHLVGIGRIGPSLRDRYEDDDSLPPLAARMGEAHDAAGRLAEYVAHQVIRRLGGETEVPVHLIDMPAPGGGP